MKKWLALALTLGLAGQGLSAKGANKVGAGEALMRKSDCFSCHQVKQKLIGPSFLEVAKKYRGKAGSEAQLMEKIKVGGAGHWGQVAMTAHPDLRAEDAAAMVRWILSQK